MARWIEIPKRGIHGSRIQTATAEFRRIASVNNRPQPQLQRQRQRQSHGDQRDPAGTLTPKRSVCQHRKPPIKGIILARVVTWRSLFLVKVPSGRIFNEFSRQKILFGLGVVSEHRECGLSDLRSYMPRGKPTTLTQRSTINSASTTTAPMLMMPHTSADNRSRLTADLYLQRGKDSRDVHH